MRIKKNFLIILTILYTLFFTQICFATDIYDFIDGFIENKAVMKSLEAKCQSNDLPSCLLLGSILNDKKYYEKACDFNDNTGCFLAGGTQFNDKNNCIKKLPFLKKSCDLNHDKGCLFLGDFYNGYCRYIDNQRFNVFVPTASNTPLSLKYYTKACDLNNRTGCLKVGLYYEKKGNTNKDAYKKAHSYYKKSCSLYRSRACYRLANLYILGHGVKQNLSKSISYYQKACDNNTNQSIRDWYDYQSCNMIKNLKIYKENPNDSINPITTYADTNIEGDTYMNETETYIDVQNDYATSIEDEIELDILFNGYKKYID